MRFKSTLGYSALVLFLVILVASGPVAAADTWLRVDPQDQVIAWGQFNANANKANLFPYASPGSALTIPTLGVWKNFTTGQPVPVAPQPTVQPAPTTGTPVIGDKTIGGTPVSDLFKNAMANYRINPPKTPSIPGGNKPIYSNQIPLIW